MVSKECPTLKAIIYTRNYTTAESPAHPAKVNGVKVLSMDEAVELGKANPTPMEAPTPDHVGLIMYTSGTLYVLVVPDVLSYGCIRDFVRFSFNLNLSS